MPRLKSQSASTPSRSSAINTSFLLTDKNSALDSDRLSESLELFGDLESELASRRQDEPEEPLGIFEQALKHRKRKRTGLTGTCKKKLFTLFGGGKVVIFWKNAQTAVL